MIKAEIICDSIGEHGKRLTTFVLTYPRFVHAEFTTHRMISKNSASSRAIPLAKMIQDVLDHPAEPVFWGKNQAGMAAAEELTGDALTIARKEWHGARLRAVELAESLNQIGLHKQIANRVLEPWFHMRVIASATEWANFFFLRSHPAAQPEIQALSDAMLFAYVNHAPVYIGIGEWHLPFIDRASARDGGLLFAEMLKVSVARCARVSYLNHDGTSTPIEKDIELYDRLTTSGHWSPTEHPARCLGYQDRSGNFIGWQQHRKQFALENTKATPGQLAELLKARQEAGSTYACGGMTNAEGQRNE